MKANITDELLSAYVDGELDAADARTVSEALLRDPGLRRRAERFGAVASAVRDSLDDVASRPVPPALLAVFDQHPRAVPAWRLPVTVAAALALVVGTLCGYWLAGAARGPADSLAWSGSLSVTAAEVLDSVPSGAVADLGMGPGRVRIQPVLSFRDARGRICRQYTVERVTPPETTDGIACRGADGTWRMEIARLRAVDAQPATQQFSPAAGAAADGFSTLVDALIAQPLLPEEERALLRSGWR